MSTMGIVRAVCCGMLCVMVPLAWGQGTARPASLATIPGSEAGLAWPQAKVRFSAEKPVLGLPLKSSRSMVRCGSDNTAYFNLDGGSQLSDVAGAPRLYSISTGGEVKSLVRKLPVDFNEIEVRDFFVADRSIVTLVHAAKSDSQGVRETEDLLSMLDPDGDFKDLVKVESHFRPLKVAVFGDGEMLVLGWDEANLLPTLAVLKPDGTIRRFLDTDDRKAKGAFDPTNVSLKRLQGAAFVAYGGEVLLTFPGTSQPVVILNAAGVDGTIPIQIPAGFVLSEVLNSSARGPLVVRVQAMKESTVQGQFDESSDPKRRLLEVSSYSGQLIREFVFDKPKISDVTCGASYAMTAIFADTIPDANTSGKVAAGPEEAEQLVVATARR